MPAPPASADRGEIVIVDDDQAVRGSLKLRFELEALPVSAFASAEAALETTPKAACFVLDLRLPGMNGLEFLREMRRRGATAPAILITSAPALATRAEAKAAGVTIVEKPLLGDVLADAVKSALAGP